jgi:hypothetical protein
MAWLGRTMWGGRSVRRQELDRAGPEGAHRPFVDISAMLGAALRPPASIDARSMGRRRAPYGARGGTKQEQNA